MKSLYSITLLGAALLLSAPVFAENRAVTIDMVSNGGALDNAALHAVRKTIGHAISNNTVDTFIVYSPRTGGPLFREGGLSACAEAGFGTSAKSFAAFIQQLHAIHPKSGTSFNVEAVARCKPIDPVNCMPVEPLTCGGIAGRPCPGDQACVDNPKDTCDPAHGGADCSGICVAKPK